MERCAVAGRFGASDIRNHPEPRAPVNALISQLQTTLGDSYRIERELGGGGMSRVILATETALDRKVVLKVLPPEMVSGVSVERFKREINLAARLQHPNIVPLLATGDAGGLRWFSMPYVQGESLRAALVRGELPIADAVRTIRDVASALAHAHAHGVVHRDIKPDNILLTEGGALVADFGIARAISEAAGATLTSTGVAVGTPAYMSPEQAGGGTSVDHRADVYALGMVGYEMLTGHNPFAGRTAQATFAAHMQEVPPPVTIARPTAPPVLAQLIARCLAKSPADRPQTAQEVVTILDALATPGGTPAWASTGNRPSARARRVGLAAAVVAVVGLGAWGLWASRGAPQQPRVAIIPFENLTGDSAYSTVGDLAAMEVASGILQAGQHIVDRDAIRALIGGRAPPPTDLTARLASEHGVTLVIKGTLTRVGDSVRVQATATDAKSGDVRFQVGPESAPLTDPMAAVARLRERILGGVVSADVARSVAVTLRPPKYTAYLEYMRARTAVNANEDTEVACPPAVRAGYDRAIALDSTYVDALVARAQCDRWGNDTTEIRATPEGRTRPSPRSQLIWPNSTRPGQTRRSTSMPSASRSNSRRSHERLHTPGRSRRNRGRSGRDRRRVARSHAGVHVPGRHGPRIVERAARTDRALRSRIGRRARANPGSHAARSGLRRNHGAIPARSGPRWRTRGFGHRARRRTAA